MYLNISCQCPFMRLVLGFEGFDLHYILNVLGLGVKVGIFLPFTHIFEPIPLLSYFFYLNGLKHVDRRLSTKSWLFNLFLSSYSIHHFWTEETTFKHIESKKQINKNRLQSYTKPFIWTEHIPLMSHIPGLSVHLINFDEIIINN